MTRLNMIPFTHVSDYEQFRQGLENFWTPFQIPMGQDSLHFNREMNAATRDIWRRNLANLTTSDVEIMDNVGLGILAGGVELGLLEAPESRMMLAQQAFQEALHTLSYQHIIESVGMLPEEQALFYNLWQEVQPMVEKVKVAANITKELSEVRLARSTSLLDYVTCAFFYWGIYEGVWFQAGFNPNLAITKFYGLTPGTAEQLAYIQRDESEHIKFGLRYLRRIIYQQDSTFRKALTPRLHEISELAIDMEADYIEWLYADQRLIGYGPEQHIEFCKHLLNTRFVTLGLSPLFPASETSFPRWRDEMLGRMESNFFEKHVKEYRVGSELNWED